MWPKLPDLYCIIESNDVVLAFFPTKNQCFAALFPTSFRCSTAFFGTNPSICYVFTGNENVGVNSQE